MLKRSVLMVVRCLSVAFALDPVQRFKYRNGLLSLKSERWRRLFISVLRRANAMRPAPRLDRWGRIN